MAKDVEQGVVKAQAAKEPTKQNEEASVKADSQEEVIHAGAGQPLPEEEGIQANFSARSGASVMVLPDGTRVSNGDVVDDSVFAELQKVRLDGDIKLLEEEGE